MARGIWRSQPLRLFFRLLPGRKGEIMNRSAKVTLIVLSLVLFVAGFALAQTFQASVSGIVNDPTGAVVPSAKVTVTDTERGTAYTATTNQDGVYLINNLIPSTYKVTAEASGFQTYQLNSFPLTAKQEAVLNITLTIGATNQTVEVSSQVQMIEPSSATLGGVVNNKSIVDLPLVNRNVLTLMAIDPGVAPPLRTITRATFSPVRFATPSTAGWNPHRIFSWTVSLCSIRATFR